MKDMTAQESVAKQKAENISEGKEKKVGRLNIWAKLFIVIGEVLLSLLFAASVVGAFVMMEAGFYNTSLYRIVDDAFTGIYDQDCRFLLGNTLAEDYSRNNNDCDTNNIVYASVTHQTGNVSEEITTDYNYDENGLVIEYDRSTFDSYVEDNDVDYVEDDADYEPGIVRDSSIVNGYYINGEYYLEDMFELDDDKGTDTKFYVDPDTGEMYGIVPYEEESEESGDSQYGVTYVTITDIESEELWSYGDEQAAENSLFTHEYYYWEDGEGYTCRIALNNELTEKDNYRTLYSVISFCYSLRFGVYFIALFSVIGWIVLYVVLLRNAGYAKGSSVAKPCFESYIPFEIHLGAMFLASLFMVFVMGYISLNNMETVILFSICLLAFEVFFLLWSICFAIRIKTRFLWRTMILRWVIKGIGWLFKNMPFIWQAVLGYAALAVLFLISAALIGHYGICTTSDLVGWIMFVILIVCSLAFGVWIAIGYRKLEQKTSRLAKGDMSGDVDTRFMLPLFVKQAENLKTISGGIVISNEKRLASERTQTALITNVSHDIKTPLTSIINYSDLISKEKSDNEKITEYAEVLGRQSTRLKRLLEDLIEVSKAQSGALEVNLQSCEVATLINQAAGEFEEKLNSCNLELITKGTEKGIMIMADPRRMWRVFDNLLGNICKYAQPGTRVYLNVEENNGKCSIVFKNTSSRELDMSPEELMARFVRGDKSREGAEGNGLGLSIASNLVQLQKGNMEISIDGDLFKVTLEFPSESA